MRKTTERLQKELLMEGLIDVVERRMSCYNCSLEEACDLFKCSVDEYKEAKRYFRENRDLL